MQEVFSKCWQIAARQVESVEPENLLHFGLTYPLLLLAASIFAGVIAPLGEKVIAFL